MKILTILLILISGITLAQKSDAIQGYYDLSQHEAPTHLYLLADNSFYYYSIFGSVDLEIYGKYSISNNELRFAPRAEQMQSYILYGRKNEALKDSLAFNYVQSNQKQKFQLVLGVDKKWYKRPMAQIKKDEISYKVLKPKTDTISLAYPAEFNRIGNVMQFSEIVKSQIPEGFNDFIIPYNSLGYMRKRFAEAPMQMKGQDILRGSKTITKTHLKDGELEQITALISKKKMFSEIIKSRGNQFAKIPVLEANQNTKLKINKNGYWTKLVMYNKNGVVDDNGNFYYEKGKLKQQITRNNQIYDGEIKIYHENGLVGIIKNLKNGIEYGEQKIFYPSGKLRSLGIYGQDGKEGTWKTFYENGNVEEIENYINGRLNGAYKKYAEDGKLIETFIY